MSLISRNEKRTKRRVLRIRKNIRKNHLNDKIRITVFRSLKDLYAQAIDDKKSHTLASINTSKVLIQGDKKTLSFEAGKVLAKELISKGVLEAIFDRGRYLYHGRVRFFVEGLREGGLKI